MLRLIFKLFKRKMTKLVMSEINKPPGFSDMELVFVGADGKKYYRFSDEMNIPNARRYELEQRSFLANYLLTGRELDKFVGVMLAAVNEGLGKIEDKNSKVRDQGKASFQRAQFMLLELQNRRKHLYIDTDFFIDMMAVWYVREDEQPWKFDEQIHREKIETFTKELSQSEDTYAFFLSRGITELLPYLKRLQGNWAQERAKSLGVLRRYNKVMEWLSFEAKQYASGKDQTETESSSAGQADIT